MPGWRRSIESQYRAASLGSPPARSRDSADDPAGCACVGGSKLAGCWLVTWEHARVKSLRAEVAKPLDCLSYSQSGKKERSFALQPRSAQVRVQKPHEAHLQEEPHHLWRRPPALFCRQCRWPTPQGEAAAVEGEEESCRGDSAKRPEAKQQERSQGRTHTAMTRGVPLVRRRRYERVWRGWGQAAALECSPLNIGASDAQASRLRERLGALTGAA